MCDIRLKIVQILYGKGKSSSVSGQPRSIPSGNMADCRLSIPSGMNTKPEKPVMINGKNTYLSLSPADSLFAMQYARGDIANGLRGRVMPVARADSEDETVSVDDETGTGLLSAAWTYAFDLKPGESKEVVLAAPLHESLSHMKTAGDFGELRQEYVTFWNQKLDRVGFELANKAVVNTVKSQAAYILLNNDGVVIQPGARSYNRTWMRDGAMISSTLMRLGFFRGGKGISGLVCRTR